MSRLREDGETLVLKIDPARRARLKERDPDAFFLTEHYRTHTYVLIDLLAVNPSTLRKLIELTANRCASTFRMIKTVSPEPRALSFAVAHLILVRCCERTLFPLDRSTCRKSSSV
jgi:hypothetical protein